MQVFMTGAGGMIGKRLTRQLTAGGHSVTQLVRGAPTAANQRQWNSEAQTLSPNVLQGCEALIHLAGENIAEGRWTEEKKRKIRHSRVHGTELLAQAVSGMAVPPAVVVVASAIGYYGDRGAEPVTETSPPDASFLGEVCQAWEAAADACRNVTRVVHVRTGIVLSPEGGALSKMLLPFKLCAGGVVGPGTQYWSWITLNDIVRMFQFAMEQEGVVGPINGVSPQPVTNREFTKILAKAVGRPAVIPMPAAAARLALGEMADALLLASTRVVPEVAQQQGFEWQNPELQAALSSMPL